jgi:reactive intermediate/imine deaminase
MSRTPIQIPNAPAPGGAYSQGMVVGDLLFTAGMGPSDPVTRETVGETTAEQTRQTLRNLAALLDAAGCTFRDVVKVTTHLADLSDFQEYDAAYREFFEAPYPVRTTVGSQLAGIRVEIDLVAAIPRSEG